MGDEKLPDIGGKEEPDALGTSDKDIITLSSQEKDIDESSSIEKGSRKILW